MKKRIFAIFLCLIAVMTVFVLPVTVSAEESIGEITDNSSQIVDEPVFEPPSTTEGETQHNTVFTRIWEFIIAYPGETLSVVGSSILLILNLVLKHSSSKMSKETKKALSAIQGEVSETLGGQNSVVGVVNEMIGGYNNLSDRYDAMKISYDLYGAMEGERNRVVGAVLATNTAILEILTTVYVNSKNLPQGVKDLVNLKYANCLKSLGEDEKLKSIVEAVRNNIGTTVEVTETKTEDAEV